MSGKKFADSLKSFDRDQLFTPTEAVTLAKSMSKAKFDEGIDVAVRLGVDPRKADQMVRGTVALPEGTGKNIRVAVFASGEAAQAARDAGADIVGADDLVAAIEKGNIDFDLAIATPDMMPLVGRLGRVLGPRGLMPNPKTGTVTFEIANAVREIKAGKVEFRVDKTGIIHAPVGKASFATDSLVANAHALVDSIVKAKPSAAKGKYLRSVTLSSTMGPGIRIDTTHIDMVVKH
jgi:large subunit ribosomal protein L1